MPHLQLLGSAKFIDKDRIMDIPPKQSLLLASYLAYKEDWVSRDELVHLFWTNENEKTARHNLSQLLYYCKQQAWTLGLEVERSRVRWLIETDVRQFQNALGNGIWQKASNYYNGKLLADSRAHYAPNFEDWLEQERESLHNSWREAVLAYCSQLEEAKKYDKASKLLQKVLNQDSLAEDILQAFMRCCLKNNKRKQALRAYERFVKELKQELNMAPLEPTQNLAIQIQSLSKKKTKAKSKPPLLAFPKYQSPFIGRDLELAELSGLIQDKSKLITILGPGGIGKTRLSIQLAYENLKYFADGAVFVSLADIDSPSLIIPQIIEELGLDLEAGQDNKEFLLRQLKDKNMLVILDNLEHLKNAVEIISDLLEPLADIQFIVSSREILDIRAETIYDLRGLSYPKKIDDSLEDYDAIQLFLRSARRAHISFNVNKQNQQGIIKICQILNGSPLALELAATWVRILSPAEIASEIEDNLKLLSSQQKDLPKRHQSMQAVLEHSWALLSQDEQTALKKLAVFKAGFSKEAANTVAQAHLRMLLSLINKSLITRKQSSRFERLTIVRQFCLDKLKQNPEQLSQAEQEHAQYFVKLVEIAKSNLSQNKQAEYLNTIKQDHSNIRAALSYLILSKEENLALEMAESLSHFWWLHGHYQEGRDFAKQSLELSDQKTSLRATVIGKLGSLARLCEDYVEARALYQECLAIQRLLKNKVGIATSLGNLAMLSRIEGDYKSARQLIVECLQIYTKLDNKQQIANTLNNFAAIEKAEGNHKESLELNKQSLKIALEIGNQFIAARCLGNMAIDSLNNKDYQNAQKLAKQSLEMFKELNYKVGIAVTQQIIGDISLQIKDYKKTRKFYLKAIKDFNNIADKRGIAEVLASFAELAYAQSKYKRALKYSSLSNELHRKLGISQVPDSKESLEKIIADSKTRLKPQQWQKAISKIQKLSIKKAYRYALGYPKPTKELLATKI